MGKERKSKPDGVIANSPQERALCRALVPPYFWNPNIDNVSFRATKLRGKVLSAAAQKQWATKLQLRIPRRGPLIVIGSEPTDTGALYTAYYMLLGFRKRTGRDVAVLDAAQPVPRLEGYPGCAVVHNVLEKATGDRVQAVRDIVTRFHYTMKLVVVAGTKDPEKWAVTKAALYPDLVLYVKDMTPEELRAE